MVHLTRFERPEWLLPLFLAIILPGCCGARDDDDPGIEISVPASPGDQPQAPDPTPAPAPAPTPPPGGGGSQLVIAPGGGGLGGTQITSDGRPVWPPSGPGCDRYIECCNAAVAVDSAMALSCQLFLAAEPADCTTALTQVRSQLTELGRPVPPQCSQ